MLHQIGARTRWQVCRQHQQLKENSSTSLGSLMWHNFFDGLTCPDARLKGFRAAVHALVTGLLT
jgi:hypothetical protein